MHACHHRGKWNRASRGPVMMLRRQLARLALVFIEKQACEGLAGEVQVSQVCGRHSLSLGKVLRGDWDHVR